MILAANCRFFAFGVKLKFQHLLVISNTNIRRNNMFVVKIVDRHLVGGSDSPVLSSVYLRQWEELEVWYPGSENYNDKVKQLKEDVALNPEGFDNEELQRAIDMCEEYSAFVTYLDRNGDRCFYCITKLEEVYITDSSGNTVHAIR